MSFKELKKYYILYQKEKDSIITDMVKKIKKSREDAGLTQEQVASLLNMSRPNYNLIENGKITLTVEKMIDLCIILNKDLSDLL